MTSKQGNSVVRGIVFALLIFISVFGIFYLAKLSGILVAPDWEHVDEVTVDETVKFVYHQVIFDEHKPTNCKDGIYVTDGYKEVSFEIVDEKYEDSLCAEAQIKFANDIYNPGAGKELPSEEKGLPEEKPGVSKEQPPKEEPVEEPGFGKAIPEGLTGKITESSVEKTYYILYGKIIVTEGIPEPITMPPEKETPKGEEEKGIPEELIPKEEMNITLPAPTLIGIINFVPPTPENGSTVEDTTVIFNLTINGTATDVILELNGEKEPMIAGFGSWYLEKNVSNGNYAYQVYAIIDGNETSSGLRTFNVVPAETFQGAAEIGKPVEWTKEILIGGFVEINLPVTAHDIIIIKNVEDQLFDVGSENISVSIGGIVQTLSEYELQLQKMTDTDYSLIAGKIKLIINDNGKSYTVHYKTKAPELIQKDVSEFVKQFKIYTPVLYENVLVEINTTEAPLWNIKLYKNTTDGTKIKPLDGYTDTNGDGLVDQIKWIALTSDETFETSIEIINVHSDPVVGGQWSVYFTTIGTSDLKITAFNGTQWSNENEDYDLRFLEIKCGDQTLNYEWQDGSVIVKDFNCNENAHETVKVISHGVHTLQFEFNGQTVYAYNYADDWAQGRRDQYNNGTIDLPGPRTNKTLWQAFNGSQIISGVSIHDGVVFASNWITNLVLGKNATFAIDARTGALKWIHDNGIYSVTYSQPAVYQDIVVYATSQASSTGSAGKVYALDADTGNEIWTYATLAGSNWPVTIGEGIVAVPRYENGANNNGSVHVLDVESGTHICTYTPATGTDSIDGKPLIKDGIIYMPVAPNSNTPRIAAIYTNNCSLVWGDTIPTDGWCGFSGGSPVTNGTHIFLMNECGTPWSTTSSTTRWTLAGAGKTYNNTIPYNGPRSATALYGNLAIAAQYNGSGTRNVFAVYQNNLSVAWKYALASDFIYCGPIVANGVLYVNAHTTNQMIALNATTGALIWNYTFPATVANAYGLLSVWNGTLYTGTLAGGIFAFRDNETAPTQSTPIFNTTAGAYTSLDNLTCYANGVSDAEVDPTYAIYNFYKNNKPDMSLYLPLDNDDSAGTGKTKDYSSNGKNGTVSGATWATGKTNYAYYFDGVNDLIDDPNSNGALNGGNSATIEVWFKADSLTGSRQTLFEEGDLTYGYWLDANNGSGNFEFGVRDSSSNYAIVTYPNSGISSGWHQLVGIWNGSAKTLKLYVDSVKVAEVTGSLQIVGTGAGFSCYDVGTADDYVDFNNDLVTNPVGALGYTLNWTSCYSTSHSIISWGDLGSWNAKDYFQLQNWNACTGSPGVEGAGCTFNVIQQVNYLLSVTNPTDGYTVGGASIHPIDGANYYFKGRIDEVRVYNKTLSGTQVYEHYLTNYNKIVANEVSGGDNWTCEVTVTDGLNDSAPTNSSAITILATQYFTDLFVYSTPSVINLSDSTTFIAFYRNHTNGLGIPGANCGLTIGNNAPVAMVYNSGTGNYTYTWKSDRSGTVNGLISCSKSNYEPNSATATAAVNGNWYNMNWRYFIPVTVVSDNGVGKAYWPIDKNMTFKGERISNCSNEIRVIKVGKLTNQGTTAGWWGNSGMWYGDNFNADISGWILGNGTGAGNYGGNWTQTPLSKALMLNNTAQITNTNIYAAVSMGMGDVGRFTLEWTMMFPNANSAYGCGFHFFSSNGFTQNRSTSYLLWQNNTGMSIQNSTNDVLNVTSYAVAAPTINENYNYKAVYYLNATTASYNLSFYRDGTLYTSYNFDEVHAIKIGSYVSFRTNNESCEFDNLRVYSDGSIEIDVVANGSAVSGANVTAYMLNGTVINTSTTDGSGAANLFFSNMIKSYPASAAIVVTANNVTYSDVIKAQNINGIYPSSRWRFDLTEFEEITSQTATEGSNATNRWCRVIFPAAVSPNLGQTYYIYYGNPNASYPNYAGFNTTAGATYTTVNRNGLEAFKLSQNSFGYVYYDGAMAIWFDQLFRYINLTVSWGQTVTKNFTLKESGPLMVEYFLQMEDPNVPPYTQRNITDTVYMMGDSELVKVDYADLTLKTFNATNNGTESDSNKLLTIYPPADNFYKSSTFRDYTRTDRTIADYTSCGVSWYNNANVYYYLVDGRTHWSSYYNIRPYTPIMSFYGLSTSWGDFISSEPWTRTRSAQVCDTSDRMAVYWTWNLGPRFAAGDSYSATFYITVDEGKDTTPAKFFANQLKNMTTVDIKYGEETTGGMTTGSCDWNKNCNTGYCRSDYSNVKFCARDSTACVHMGLYGLMQTLASQGLMSSNYSDFDSNIWWCNSGYIAEDPYTAPANDTYMEFKSNTSFSNSSAKITLPINATLWKANIKVFGEGWGYRDENLANTSFGTKILPMTNGFGTWCDNTYCWATYIGGNITKVEKLTGNIMWGTTAEQLDARPVPGYKAFDIYCDSYFCYTAHADGRVGYTNISNSSRTGQLAQTTTGANLTGIFCDPDYCFMCDTSGNATKVRTQTASHLTGNASRWGYQYAEFSGPKIIGGATLYSIWCDDTYCYTIESTKVWKFRKTDGVVVGGGDSWQPCGTNHINKDIWCDNEACYIAVATSPPTIGKIAKVWKANMTAAWCTQTIGVGETGGTYAGANGIFCDNYYCYASHDETYVTKVRKSDGNDETAAGGSWGANPFLFSIACNLTGIWCDDYDCYINSYCGPLFKIKTNPKPRSFTIDIGLDNVTDWGSIGTGSIATIGASTGVTFPDRISITATSWAGTSFTGMKSIAGVEFKLERYQAPSGFLYAVLYGTNSSNPNMPNSSVVLARSLPIYADTIINGTGYYVYFDLYPDVILNESKSYAVVLQANFLTRVWLHADTTTDRFYSGNLTTTSDSGTTWSVSIGDAQVKLHETELREIDSPKVANPRTKLTNLLRNCSCAGCVSSGGNCTITINMTSMSSGGFIIDPNFQYTLGSGGSCTKDEDCNSGFCRNDYLSGIKYCASNSTNCVSYGTQYPSEGLFTRYTTDSGVGDYRCNNGHWAEEPLARPANDTSSVMTFSSAGSNTSTVLHVIKGKKISVARIDVTGKYNYNNQLNLTETSKRVNAITLDDSYVYVGENGTNVLIYNKSSWANTQNLTNMSYRVLALANDDEYLYVGDSLSAKVYSKYDWTLIRNFTSFGAAASFAVDDTYLYVGTTPTVIVYQKSDWINIRNLTLNNDYAYDLLVDEDYLYVAEGSGSNVVRVYNRGGFYNVFNISIYPTYNAYGLTDDAEYLYAATYNGTYNILRVYNKSNSWSSVRNITIPDLAAFSIYADPNYLYVGGDFIGESLTTSNKTYIYRKADWTNIKNITSPDRIASLAVDSNGTIYVGDSQTTTQVEVYNRQYPTNPIIDFGLNGDDWTYSGNLTQTISPQTVLFKTALDSLADNCTCTGCIIDGLYCNITVNISSGSTGIIELDDLVIGFIDHLYWNPEPTDQEATTGVMFTYDINATDTKGHTITYAINDSSFTINATTGVINKTFSVTGTTFVKVNATCTGGELVEATFTITVKSASGDTCNKDSDCFSRYCRTDLDKEDKYCASNSTNCVQKIGGTVYQNTSQGLFVSDIADSDNIGWRCNNGHWSEDPFYTITNKDTSSIFGLSQNNQTVIKISNVTLRNATMFITSKGTFNNTKNMTNGGIGAHNSYTDGTNIYAMVGANGTTTPISGSCNLTKYDMSGVLLDTTSSGYMLCADPELYVYGDYIAFGDVGAFSTYVFNKNTFELVFYNDEPVWSHGTTMDNNFLYVSGYGGYIRTWQTHIYYTENWTMYLNLTHNLGGSELRVDNNYLYTGLYNQTTYGWGWGYPYGRIEIYNKSNSFSSVKNISFDSSQFESVNIFTIYIDNNYLYAAGGPASGSAKIYVFQIGTWNSVANITTTISNITSLLVDNNKIYAYGNNPSAKPRLEVYEVGSWTRTTSYDTSCNESTYTLGYKLSSDGTNIYVACPWAGVMVFQEGQAYPSSVYVDFGLDGSDYTYAGELSQTISPERISPADEIRSLIPTCNCAGCYFDIGNNACEINISVNSSTSGSIELDNFMSQTDTAPVVNSLFINSSSGQNISTDNLTCYVNTSDVDLDYITNIFNWSKNYNPYAIVIYPFDDSVSSTSQDAILDYSGTTNHGTLGDGAGSYAPTWTSSGKVGGAYDFGLTNTKYIKIDDQDSLDTQEFTFEAWIKPRNLSNAYPTVYTRRGQTGTDGFIWLMIYGNTIYYQYANGTNIRAAQTSALTWNLNQWYHIAVTSSNVTKKIDIYRDGISVGSFDIDQILPMLDQPGYLGTYNGVVGGVYDWNGTMDEVRIYNRSLSAAQIKQRYFESSEVAKYTFDGNSAKDLSGYGNDGTVNGATWTAAGKVGGAYAFNGVSSYIDLGNSAIIKPSNITVSAWVWANSTNGNIWPKIIDGNNDNYGYQLWLDYGGARGYVFSTGNGTAAQAADSYVATKQQWVFVVGVNNGTHNMIYVDGVLKNTSAANPIDYSAITTVRIGNRGSDARWWNGSIDQVRIYNYSLNANQVKQLYNEGLYGYGSTIVADELDKDDLWACAVTPSDSYLDGTTNNTDPVTIQSASPTTETVTVSPSPINLNACNNLTVYCSATVTDPDGAGDLSSVNGELYDDDSVDTGCTANPNNCYTNSSCALTGCSGTTCTANCTFTPVRHYTNASANWKCNLTATDTGSLKSSNYATATVNNLTAIDAANTINFGSVTPGTYSSNTSENIINCGNMLLDTMINGSGMTCGFGTILVGNISYSASQASGYVALTNTLTTLDFNLLKATSDAGSNKNNWWRLYVPTIVAGSCIGNVTFVSIYGG
jgi:hypothetical protein